MKKYSLIALLLVFAMCLSLGMTGCQKDDAATTDPAETTVPVQELTLELAADNTVKALSSDDLSAGVFENMDEKKVITIALDHEEGQLQNVLNLDLPSKSFYDELSLTVDGQTVNANVYCDGKALAVTAPELLGADQALGVNFETLITDLENSTLMDALTASEFGMVLESLESYQDMLDGVTSTNELEEKLIQDLTVLLEDETPTKSDGTVTVYDETVNAVNFTYVIEKDLVKQVLDIYLDFYSEYMKQVYAPMVESGVMTQEDLDAMIPDLEALQAEIDAVFEAMELDCTAVISVNPENQCIMRFDFNVSVTYEEETVVGTVAFILGKNPAESDLFTMDVNLKAPEDSTLNLKATLANTTEGAVDAIKLNVDVDIDGEKNNASLTCSYNNDTKEYKLTAEVDEEALAVTGKLESTDSKLLFTVDQLEAADETIQIGLTITVENNPNCQIPAVPAYTNVLTDMDLAALLGLDADSYLDEEYTEDWEDYEEWDDSDWEDYEEWDDSDWEDYEEWEDLEG